MEIPIIMCVWNRIDRLAETLRCLEQQVDQDFTFFIWNNNYTEKDMIHDIILKSRIRTELFHSKSNIGGFGRFYFAKELIGQKHNFVIFIDDDQVFSENLVQDFRSDARPKSIIGWWAKRFKPSQTYWDRERVNGVGENAHYIGTCGMLCDISIFCETRLFTDCPKEYWFIEDLWLCYFANHILGWELLKGKATLEMVYDHKGQFEHLRKEKVDFLNFLRSKGWHV